MSWYRSYSSTIQTYLERSRKDTEYRVIKLVIGRKVKIRPWRQVSREKSMDCLRGRFHQTVVPQNYSSYLWAPRDNFYFSIFIVLHFLEKMAKCKEEGNEKK